MNRVKFSGKFAEDSIGPSKVNPWFYKTATRELFVIDGCVPLERVVHAQVDGLGAFGNLLSDLHGFAITRNLMILERIDMSQPRQF